MAAPAPDQMPRPPSLQTQSYESFVGRSPTPPPNSARVDPNRRPAPVFHNLNIEQQPPTRAQTHLPHLESASQGFSQEQSTLILHGEQDLPKAQLRAKLSVIAGEQLGEEHILNRALTRLGRALENDIVLIDIAASRKHLELKRHAEGFTLKDLNSANGVSINGRRVLDDELYDGDVIEVGETQLRFETIGGHRGRPLEEEQDTDPGLTAIPSPTVTRTRARPHAPPAVSPPPYVQSPASPYPTPPAPPPAPPAVHPPPTSPSYTPRPNPVQGIPAPLSTTSMGFGGSVDSATIEQLATPQPAMRPPQTSSRLPFAPPSWEGEGEDLIELEPIPEVPEENLGGPPKPQNPWKTMGLSGLSAQDLGLQPEKKSRLSELIERSLALWDELMLRSGLDRIPTPTLVIISASLVASLILGLFVGRLNQLSPEEYQLTIQSHLARGELSEAQALLQNAEEHLDADTLLPLQSLVSAALKVAEARVAFKVAFKEERWGDGLKIILEQLPAQDPELISLQASIIKIKLHVIQGQLAQAYQLMWRGQLGPAESTLTELQSLLTSDRFKIVDVSLESQVKRLKFALALHRERLELKEGEVIAVSSPPSDQRSLEEAAKLTRQGELNQARSLLERSMPSLKSSASTPLRRKLFQLRLDALKRRTQKARKTKSRAQSQERQVLEEGDIYLLAHNEDLNHAFSAYFKALRASIKAAKYPLVARYLAYTELLQPRNIQVLEYRQRLTQRASQWLQMAEESHMKGQTKEAKLLVSTALLFLNEDLKPRALTLQRALP